MVKPLPFKENGSLRTFSASVNETELQWHWDDEDRIVYPIHATNWRVQLDNQLPKPLVPNYITFIPAGIWHRLIKGDGDVTLRVVKCP
jgi:hypothetical protein